MWTWTWPFTRRYDIYTDGSYKHGRGSWAYVIVKNRKVQSEMFGREKNTTSNHMEIRACVEALKSLPAGSRVLLHTDSRILVATATELIPEWKKNNWLKKNGLPIPHGKLVRELAPLLQMHKVQWQWVKAHSGIPFNERCDELCVLARS